MTTPIVVQKVWVQVSAEAADEIEFLRAQLAKETKNKKEFERDWLECCVTAEKYRKEAKRYQWLRDVGDATWRPFGIRAGYSADMADAAIDEAMTPNAGHERPARGD